jgi:catechol 2,3-dioxygenase-like lactoylglutathione lyase family enzyme
MSGSPLPLLGTFHEVSIAVTDVRACIEFYELLGFTHATATDAFAHPYGVLTDGRLVIGLHERAGPSPVLTFVRPDIARCLPAFADAAIELTVNRTGDEVFNEVGFLDPGGHSVAVLEARTYSPAARSATEVSQCGDFAEVSFPATDFERARQFWEPLGFVAAEEATVPYHHLPLTSDYLDIAFHEPRFCPRPMLVFREPAMAERIGRLRGQGLSLTDALPRGAVAAAFLDSPDGTRLLLVAGEE